MTVYKHCYFWRSPSKPGIIIIQYGKGSESWRYYELKDLRFEIKGKNLNEGEIVSCKHIPTNTYFYPPKDFKKLQ